MKLPSASPAAAARSTSATPSAGRPARPRATAWSNRLIALGFSLAASGPAIVYIIPVVVGSATVRGVDPNEKEGAGTAGLAGGSRTVTDGPRFASDVQRQ